MVKRGSWDASWGFTMDAAILPRKLAARFAALVLAAGVFAAFADTARAQIPTINIQETCRAAAGVMLNLAVGGEGRTGPNDEQICLEGENKARDQIIKGWSTFDPSDREGCIQTRVYLPSYVEWLTCFEMNKVVREARTQQGRAMKSVTNPDGSMTLPPVRSLGINMSGYGNWGGYRRYYRY
jgi:hypothetical protein